MAKCSTEKKCVTVLPSVPPSTNFTSVSVVTDKAEYVQGSDLKIILENKNNESKYLNLETYSAFSSRAQSYKVDVEKYEGGSWTFSGYDFSEVRKCSAGGQGPTIGCLEINGNETLERVKSLFYLTCENNEATKVPIPAGKYRLKVYVGSDCSSLSTIYSNGFTIK